MTEETLLTHPYQNHLHKEAFESFVHFAAGNEKLLDDFKEAHPDCVPPNTVLERMIDEISGRDRAALQTFVDWCVEKYGKPEDL